jgi:transposase InsO family protein
MPLARLVVTAVRVQGRSKSEVARDYQVSRRWVHELVKRFDAEGEAGLAPGSRRPWTSPQRTPQAPCEEIILLRKTLTDQGLDAGAHTIASDITHWRLADGRHVEILKLVDDHSRLLVASHARPTTKAADVVASLHHAAAANGFPASMPSDNGAVFTAAPRGGGRCAIELELARLAITYRHSRAYHPQTCGKVERFHQTLKRWLGKQPRAATVAELQAQLDQFAGYYNHVRPHRATPLSRWAPRSRNRIPEPATRSATVRETSTSPGWAAAATLAPIWTAIPGRSAPTVPTSPVCRPTRISRPKLWTASRIAHTADRTGGTGKVAKKPSPVVATLRPPNRSSSARRSTWWASSSARQLRSPSREACSVIPLCR